MGYKKKISYKWVIKKLKNIYNHIKINNVDKYYKISIKK